MVLNRLSKIQKKAVKLGNHILVDLIDCRFDFNDIEAIKNICVATLHSCKIKIVNYVDHNSKSHGYNLIYLAAGSHLTIHTKPEERAVAIEFFTEEEVNLILKAMEMIEYFRPLTYHIREISREIEGVFKYVFR